MPEFDDEAAAAHAFLDTLPVPPGPLTKRIAAALDLVTAAAWLVGDTSSGHDFDLSAKASAGDAEERADRHGDADGTGMSPATPAPVPADNQSLRGSNSGGGAATAVDNDVDPADRAATPPAGPATPPLTLPQLLEILEDVAATRDLDDSDGDWEVEA